MVRVADAVPETFGRNVMLIVQLAPAARVLGLIGQVLVWLYWELLVPPSAMLPMVRVALPELVSTTVCGALELPTFCVPNARLLLERLTPALCVRTDNVLSSAFETTTSILPSRLKSAVAIPRLSFPIANVSVPAVLNVPSPLPGRMETVL